MASVIALIRRSEERKRGERHQDHQSVNGEKIFMSLSSADCTEVEYATKLYSESPPPVCTKTDILHSGRGAEALHRAYKWTWILQATKPILPPTWKLLLLSLQMVGIESFNKEKLSSIQQP